MKDEAGHVGSTHRWLLNLDAASTAATADPFYGGLRVWAVW
jgi:hypothetical protein